MPERGGRLSDDLSRAGGPHRSAWADSADSGQVFSRTLKSADWANTTIAAGDMAEEIDKLRRGGDASASGGH